MDSFPVDLLTKEADFAQTQQIENSDAYLEGRRFATMAKGVSDMETLCALFREIIEEGAKEVEAGYKPRCDYAKGVLENKDIVVSDHP